MKALFLYLQIAITQRTVENCTNNIIYRMVNDVSHRNNRDPVLGLLCKVLQKKTCVTVWLSGGRDCWSCGDGQNLPAWKHQNKQRPQATVGATVNSFAICVSGIVCVII